MASYSTPGVYVEEIPTLPASVAQVATAIPAFIGYTEKAPALNTPTRISSLSEFRELFGGPPIVFTLSVAGAITNGPDYTYKLFFALQMFYANGGGACWICSVGSYSDTPDLTEIQGGLAEIAKEDEPTLLLSPDATSLADIDEYYTVVKDMLAQCGALKDRFTIFDPYGDFSSMATDLATKVGNQHLSYGAAYYPPVATTLGFPDESFRFNAAAPLGTNKLSEALEIAGGQGATAATMANALMPILSTIRENQVAEGPLYTPASAAVVGVYARVDGSRGVWKAPANESINAVQDLVTLVTDEQQKTLNDPTHGKAINIIRRFKGRGFLIWGARTLDATSLEWRYVPVRRLFIMAEESIKKATEALVFEPNDANTWAKTRAMISNFLTGLWRDGALQGATPKDAFFVNAGLGTTMTAQDILNGYLNIEVGIAAVRPAEFIILKFSHKLQES